jgi:hypothetical protein
MIAAEKLAKASRFQILVLLLFAFLMFAEMISFLSSIDWVQENNQLGNVQYWYLFLPYIFNPIGLLGLYKIFKREQGGFLLFYLSFASSTFLDLSRRHGPASGLVILAGNSLLLLLFYFAVRSLKPLQKKPSRTIFSIFTSRATSK